MARVKAVLRRGAVGCMAEQRCSLTRPCDSIRLPVGCLCTNRGHPHRDEFELRALLRARGRVLRRDTLAEATYGVGHHVADRTLDSHVSRMRRKLRQAGCDPITAVRGVGYRLGG